MLIRCIVGTLLLLSTAAAVADPRITSVVPTAGGWTVTVEGIPAPQFQLDGQAVAARRAGAGESAEFTWEIPAATNGQAARLVVNGGKKDSLAVKLSPDSPAEAPFNDWTIYHVMLSQFRNANTGNDRSGLRRWVQSNYAGGDLQGVLEKVDYLKSLGVNAVWLSPTFGSETSHGYDVTNYYRIGEAVAVPGDPAASRALYDKTVAALHAAGIRVVLDIPLNHASRSYDRSEGDPKGLKPASTPAQQEAEKVWDSWNSGYRYWNFRDASTRQFLIEAGRYWLTEGKADGFRLDYVRGVPHDFWAEFNAQMKATKPDAFLFGEAWQDASMQAANAVDIASYYVPVPGKGPQFDGLLEFPLQMTMTEVFARGKSDASDLETWLQRTGALYGEQGRPVYFLDNHDVSRFLDWAVDRGKERLLAAVGFMASLSSPIVLFYGTETGLSGGTAMPGFTDSSRVAMPWNSLDQKLIGSVTKILEARSRLPAMTRGARLPVYSDREVLVMRKQHPEGDVLVAVNVGKGERTVRLPASAAGGTATSWQAVVGTSAPQGTEGTLTWTLPALSTSWATASR